MSDQNTQADGEDDPILRIAHKFEYHIILVLVGAVAIVALLAMARLLFGLYDAVFVSWDIRNYQTVQILFGMVMTVLIALEFGNSILRHIRERSTIIQAREVILIGMMAVVRKVMIIDLSIVSPLHLAALGAVAVALASAYWFMRDGGTESRPE